MPQFCRICGKKLKNPKARFCPGCGTPLAATSLLDASGEPEAPGPPEAITGEIEVPEAPPGPPEAVAGEPEAPPGEPETPPVPEAAPGPPEVTPTLETPPVPEAAPGPPEAAPIAPEAPPVPEAAPGPPEVTPTPETPPVPEAAPGPPEVTPTPETPPVPEAAPGPPEAAPAPEAPLGPEAAPGSPQPAPTMLEMPHGSPEARRAPEAPPGLPQAAPIVPEVIPAARPRLVIRVPGQPQWEVVLDREVFTIGRHPDNDIDLEHNYVSGYHGRLELRNDVWHYLDLGSTNGTYVNGQRVPSAVLRDGDILRIGDLQGNSVGLTFRAAGAVGAPAAVPSVLQVGATALGAKDSLVIGRNPQSDVPLASPVVSWQHARLDRSPRGHVITDLNSTNGTFVNGQRLARPCLLQQGDVVQIGPFSLVYEPTGFHQYAVTGGVRLDGMQLSRDVGSGRRRKRILHDIDVSIYPREFVAVVGTSGAGKSTLLMALNGFARASEGQVLVNGDDLYGRFDLYRAMVGYVPQDNIIHEELTVASALRYAARLRLPADTSAVEIEQRVDRVLKRVEMVGQKEQVVSSLSGGQRKRVSIAVELLAEPNLFFLDEPTSGLDPGLEKKMMHTLRHLADGGRTVVLVTHATANIVQCDHVCFLSQGRMVYFGPPEEALEYFGVTSGDFADIYARLDDPDPEEARRKAALGEQTFKQSRQYQQYVLDRQREVPQVQLEADEAKSRRPKASMVRQFFVLTRRYLDLVLRDRLLRTVLMLVMPIIGGLVLLVADLNWLVGNSWSEIDALLNDGLKAGSSNTYVIVGDSQRLLFIMTLASVLLGLFAAVYEIVKEWSIYQRERMVSLRIAPYIASKVVVLGLFALVQCLLFMIVIGIRVHYPTEGVLLPFAPLEMYITLVLGTLAAILLGLLISAIVPNVNAVIYIVFLVLFFQMIFAGVLFDLPGFTEHFSNLTLTRWTMEGLGTSADIEKLDELTVTRFKPRAVSREVSAQVTKVAEEWEPVTVMTTTEYIPVSIEVGSDPPVVTTKTVPISVPHVIENERIYVTETITRRVTVRPDPRDITSPQEFRIEYARTSAHLLQDWLMLIGFGLVFAVAIAIVLRRKDVR